MAIHHMTFSTAENGRILVLVDGRKVGVIDQVNPGPSGLPTGWQFRSNEGRPGELFAALQSCKKSLGVRPFKKILQSK